MKRKIRKNVFETNSSSVHTICICTKDEFKKWVDDDILCDTWNNEFASREEIKNMPTHKQVAYETYTDWKYNSEGRYEFFEKEYTSESGDEIVAFGKYGYH